MTYYVLLCDFYCPQTKLRKGNVFTPVCQSFCSQEMVSASLHIGIHPSCPVHAGIDMATPADGMHPLECIFVLCEKKTKTAN